MSTLTPSVTVQHLGGDRLEIRVRSHALFSDQPVVDGGDDTGPTPTELFLGSLASCVAFYAERFLRRHGLPCDGLAVTCDWAWAREPARVGQIQLTVDAPGLPPERLEAFERVIEHCPIHNTLQRPPEVRFKVVSRERMDAARP